MNPKAHSSDPEVRTLGAPGGTPDADPLVQLDREHRQLLALCDMLEEIADGLPDKSEPSACRKAIQLMHRAIPLHHADEERGLFPLLIRRARPEDNLAAIVTQLANEHLTDNGYAQDLVEVLESLAAGKPPSNPEMVGYMLRGFFESYRRHIAFEDKVILPLARVRLTAEDCAELRIAMLGNRAIPTPLEVFL